MISLSRKIDYALRGGETKRFHSVMTLTENTVGQHSHNVAWLCHFMSDHLDREERYSLIMAALAHDHPEQRFGDVPAPGKRGVPGLKAQWDSMEMGLQREMGFNWEDHITPEAKRILKLADAMDGALFCCRERAMGNKLVEGCYRNFLTYAQELRCDSGSEQEIMSLVVKKWSEAND